MERPTVEALSGVAERLIRSAAARVEARQQEEYVGTSEDEMVTATIARGELSLELHALARRRLDREELGAAVVEAITAAERAATDVPMDDLENDEAFGAVPSAFKDAFSDAMSKLRAL